MAPRSRVWVTDLLNVVGLTTVAVVFWQRRIISHATEPAQIMGNGDFFAQIYPMSHRAAHWIRDGTLPLWNPFQYCGHPFLATGLYGVLYPLNAAYLLLPTEIAIEATLVLHLALAGTSTYLYGRTIRLARPAALAAALTFMLSGFMAFQTAWFPPALSSAVWLPLALVAIERIAERQRFRWSLLLAIAIAMPLLAGWFQTWMYSMYVVAIYGFMRLSSLARRSDRRRSVPTTALLMLAGGVLGVCFMAPQLLPTLELQAVAARGGGLTLQQTVFLGGLLPSRLLFQAVNSEPGGPTMAYLGMLAFVLIPVSLCSGADRLRRLTFGVLAFVSVVVALTIYTPVFDLYRLLPGGSRFRAPWRILFIYAFAGAVLCGLGIDAILDRRGSAAPRRRWRVALVAAFAAVGIALFADMPRRSHGYLFLGLFLVAGALLSRRPPLRYLLVCGLLGLVTWDLFHATRNRFTHPYHDVSVFDGERAVFDYIREHQDLHRTYIVNEWEYPPIMAKQGTLRGIYSITDYEPLSLSRYDKFFRLLEGRDLHRSYPFPFTGRLRIDPTSDTFHLLDLMSVRYVVAHAHAERFDGLPRQLGSAWRRIQPTHGEHVIYENAGTLPRAYVAHGVLRASGPDEALAAVRGTTFDPRTTVVLEGIGDRALPGADPSRPISAAHVATYDPTRVVLETDVASEGYLVLTDTFYPGWTATVDGTPATIYRANYLFRAVRVGAGPHTVIFEYNPQSFRIGLVLAAAALVGIVLYALRSGPPGR